MKQGIWMDLGDDLRLGVNPLVLGRPGPEPVGYLDIDNGPDMLRPIAPIEATLPGWRGAWVRALPFADDDPRAIGVLTTERWWRWYESEGGPEVCRKFDQWVTGLLDATPAHRYRRQIFEHHHATGYQMLRAELGEGWIEIEVTEAIEGRHHRGYEVHDVTVLLAEPPPHWPWDVP